jgi:hypothetical protein
MRPILLAAFALLAFLTMLTLAQSALGLDSPQMRLILVPIIGFIPEGNAAPGATLRDLLAYLIAASAAGALAYPLGRLMYRAA